MSEAETKSTVIEPVPFPELPVGRLFTLELNGPTFIKLSRSDMGIYKAIDGSLDATISLDPNGIDKYLVFPVNPL